MKDDIKSKGEEDMNAMAQRPCSISDSLKQSCKEVRRIRSGKLPKKTWKELIKELNTEEKNKE